MRRVVITIAALCCLTSSTVAGDLFQLGLKAGANVTNPRGLADGISSTSDFTFLVGAIGQIGLGDLLSVGAELVYEGRKFTLTSTTVLPGDTTTSRTVDASTFNIPLYLRIGLPLGFSAELGVQYSHFLGSEEGLPTDGQGLALLGLAWHPIDAIRIGARFQPSFSPMQVQGIDDVGLNVTHFYVAWIIL